MGSFIAFLIVMLCMPILILLAISMLIALLIVISPFIFVGWLIGELYK